MSQEITEHLCGENVELHHLVAEKSGSENIKILHICHASRMRLCLDIVYASLISSISLHFASLCMVTASLTDRCMAASWPAARQPVLSRALLSVDCCLLPDVSWKSSTVVCYLLSVVVCCPLSIALLPAVS